MEVSPIDSIKIIDLNTVQRVLSSNKISDTQKHDFIRQNKTAIEQALDVKLTGAEFKYLMKWRPLRKFRFLRNSFTKRGDKALLGNLLDIEPCEVDDYIENVREAMFDVDKLSFLTKDKIDAIKTYVYRHGSKDDIVSFLDYELSKSNDVLQTLYRTLDYHTGGLADYFIRPVHRMTNKTLIRLYNVIDKNLNKAEESGKINEQEMDEAAKWALVRIYQIQNNSKIINAIKSYKILNG